MTLTLCLKKQENIGNLWEFLQSHNKGVDGCPPFRSILSALRAPTYKLAKYLVLILDPLTNKKNTQSKILLTLPLKLSNMIPATSWEA